MPPTWDDIVARLGDVAVPARDSTSPRARTAIESARSFDRVYKQPADILAMIERDVSEPATRERLDAMIRRRDDERMEIRELDDLSAPDERTRLERIVDALPFSIWGVMALILVVPRLVPGSLFPVVVIAALVALATASTALAVHRLRVRTYAEWRSDLLARAGLLALPAFVAGLHFVTSDLRFEASARIVVGLAAQGAAIAVLLVLALTAPGSRRFARRWEKQPDPNRSAEVIEYEQSVERLNELERAFDEDGPGLLHAALARRDPATVRSTRGAVVEATRVLYELEQIDDREAEWMLRETLDSAG